MKLFDMGISVSEKRGSETQRVQVFKDVFVSSCGTIHIKFGDTHFLPAGVCVEFGSTVVYVDPVKVQDGKKADYILITHSHPDHLSLEDLEKLSDDGTVVICSKEVGRKLGKRLVKILCPHEVYEQDNFRCEAVPAYSIGFPSHPKKSQKVGFVFGMNGVSVYHAGDTDLIKEIQQLKGIDLALVPIDGGNLTMKTKEAVELINGIQPQMVIPIHYVVEENKTKEFVDGIKDGIEVLVLAK